jgi:hypothetical protein
MRTQKKLSGAAIAAAVVLAAWGFMRPQRALADDARVTVTPAVQIVTPGSSSRADVQLVQWGRYGWRPYGYRYRGYYGPYYGRRVYAPYYGPYYGYPAYGYGYTYPAYGYGYGYGYPAYRVGIGVW